MSKIGPLKINHMPSEIYYTVYTAKRTTKKMSL